MVGDDGWSGGPADPPGTTEAPQDAAPAPARAESRAIHRIPVRLAVSSRGRSAPLGTTRDLSLRGVFIETPRPLPAGTVVPLVVELDASDAPLELEAEVVRVTDLGMGLAFTGRPEKNLRRLRRWIVDRTSVQGTQRQVEQLFDSGRNVEPLRGTGRVAALLARLKQAHTQVLLIPADRLVRDVARVADIVAGELRLVTREPSLVGAGDEVFALTQLGFDAYSFQVRVRHVEPAGSGSALVADLPAEVVYSERRAPGNDRAPAPPGTLVRWPASWDKGTHVSRPVLEHTANGLSFRVAEGECLLAPGSPLPGAELVTSEGARPLGRAEVRHITRVVEPDGAAWLRVGVAIGTSDTKPRTEVAEAPARGIVGWLKGMATRARTALVYGLHKGKARLTGERGAAERVVIHGGPHELVGLLDRTRGDERLRCPLVLVVPGFGGRKEQMSFFAGTVVEGFAHQHQDVAVLRIDGSNNIGESGKDPDCVGDGEHAKHYTISGLVADTLAALAWARKNPYVEPTHLVLVSSSMGSIGVRHVLTHPHAADVGLWVCYMGAPDAVDVIRLVSGNIDLHAYWRRGQRLGIVSLLGMLTDGDRFWADLQELGIGDFDDAKREIAKVRADIVWLYGRHDAYMEPRRVRELMSVSAPPGAQRELVEVAGGHLPRTGEEAVSQFVRLTRRIFQHAHRSPMEPFSPSVGKLAARAEAEWRRVRGARPSDRGAWWRRYLLDPAGLGFDVLELAPAYRKFMDRQAALVLEGVGDAPVLDLGAGTGNLLVRLLAGSAARVHAFDLVPEALDVARAKLAAEPRWRDRVAFEVVDADGSPLVAMRRFVAGDLASARELAERVPGVQRTPLDRLLELGADGVHAAMRGHDVDVAALARALRLPDHEAELLADLALVARRARGRDTVGAPRRLPSEVMTGAGGLPLADGSVAAVGMSLLLSYLEHPEDALFEAARVLRPGGRLVVSSLVPDYDSSDLYLSLLAQLERARDDELPPGTTREALATSARRFVTQAATLLRLAEEGHFRFYDGPALADLVRRRGFVDVVIEPAFGEPPQGVIVTCRKP